MDPLVIVGAGGFGREVLDVVEAMNSCGAMFEFLGFVDDGEVNRERLEQRSAAFLGSTETMRETDALYVIGIGNGSVRRALDERLASWERQPATLVHPAATIGGDVRLAPGVIVTAGVRVTTNVTLGRHVHLHVNAAVGHDAVLDDYATVLPGATVSGDVTIETEATLGTGSSVIQGKRIGARSFVGAGAAVVRDVPPDVTVVGVPARVLER